MSFTQYTQKKLLDHLNNVAAFTQPTTLTLALFKSDPGETGAGTEVSASTDDTAYARQTITFAATTLGTGISLSSNAQTFPAVIYGSGAAPYTVTHIGIFSNTGNMISYTALGASISRAVGKTLAFDTAAVTVALD